jgi:seryl-tRNA synthetase
MMALCAQLAQFDEELYKVPAGSAPIAAQHLLFPIICLCTALSVHKVGLSDSCVSPQVTGEGEDKYLIATSEQALCAYFQGKRIEKKDLPIRMAGYSSCFRKESGSHGRDTAGIFRVHQFEKVEQFVLTSPDGDKSWEMFKQMSKISEEFYQSLGIPYKVIDIVTGELNNAAARKYDLEAWFPASRTYRELVSCSNCLDYQSRRLECRIAGAKTVSPRPAKHRPRPGHPVKNCQPDPCEPVRVGIRRRRERTATCSTRRSPPPRAPCAYATQPLPRCGDRGPAGHRCCIVENYQTPDGVRVPEVLQPFLGGIDFFPFMQPPPVLEKPAKKKK